MRWGLLILGIILAAVGILWTLQGLNIVQGSVMTGQTVWAIIGPIVAVVGLVVVFLGLRRRAPAA